jgi:DNA-binding Lrp family transcriptional regulator
MDATDKSILDALRENARQSASEISKAVHLSVPAVA